MRARPPRGTLSPPRVLHLDALISFILQRRPSKGGIRLRCARACSCGFSLFLSALSSTLLSLFLSTLLSCLLRSFSPVAGAGFFDFFPPPLSYYFFPFILGSAAVLRSSPVDLAAARRRDENRLVCIYTRACAQLTTCSSALASNGNFSE